MNEDIEKVKDADIYITKLTSRITDMIGTIILQNPQFANSKKHRLEDIYNFKMRIARKLAKRQAKRQARRQLSNTDGDVIGTSFHFSNINPNKVFVFGSSQ